MVPQQRRTESDLRLLPHHGYLDFLNLRDAAQVISPPRAVHQKIDEWSRHSDTAVGPVHAVDTIQKVNESGVRHAPCDDEV